jgi:hypothetical protein
LRLFKIPVDVLRLDDAIVDKDKPSLCEIPSESIKRLGLVEQRQQVPPVRPT